MSGGRVATFWVGQIPSTGIDMKVLDDRNGSPVDLRQYNRIEAKILDSNNREVQVPEGGGVQLVNPSQGRLSYNFPPNQSIFTNTGEYVLQLELDSSNGRKDITTTATFYVKRKGMI